MKCLANTQLEVKLTIQILPMRPEKKTILVPCCETNSIDTILFYGIPVSNVFNASLTFLFIGDVTSFNSFIEKIRVNQSHTNNFHKFKFIRYASPYGLIPVIEKNENDEEAMMILFPQLPSGKFNYISEMNFMLRTHKLKLPYMVLQKPSLSAWKPEHIIIPVGYDRTDKETAIWASYFARFNKSHITLLSAKENETWAINSLNSNIRFMTKLFNELGLSFTIKQAQSNSGHIQEATVKLAASENNTIIILSTTKNYSIEHYFKGPVELQTIKNQENIPVLCVNPRKDLYVLCR